MKELFRGLWALFWAVIVSCLMFTIGTVYSFGYSIVMSFMTKDRLLFLKFWWRLIDGFGAALGHALYELAYALDLGWNVNGEILEDIITAEEKTHFTEKNISVSATTGDLEIRGKLNTAGKIFSKILNFAFNQKQHAIDAWSYTVAKKKLQGQYFSKRKSK